VQINGIELPDLHWVERFESFGVAATTKTTRGGKVWVWEGNKSGQPITLKGDVDMGWFTHNQYAQIKALAEVPNATYLLELFDLSTTVRFRNEDPPAINGEWVIDYTAEPENADLIGNIEIKLMVVS